MALFQDFNTVTVSGSLVDDITAKNFKGQDGSLCTFTLACHDYQQKGEGDEYVQHTTFFRCSYSLRGKNGVIQSLKDRMMGYRKKDHITVKGTLSVSGGEKQEDGSFSTTYYDVRAEKVYDDRSGNLNHAVFAGNVCSEGKVFPSKFDESGKKGTVMFRFANNPNSRKVQGEDGQETWVSEECFIDARMTVNNCEKFVAPTTGDKVSLEGYFKTDKYQDKNGNEVSRLIFVVTPETFRIVRKAGKPAANTETNAPIAEEEAPATEAVRPVRPSRRTAAPAAQDSNFADEDIPF